MAKELDASKFWLIKNNPIIKAGVFSYAGSQIGPGLEPEKRYQVLRPEEELFKAETVSSFNLIPITLDHPSSLLGSRSEGFLPAEEKGMEGTTGESAKKQGDKVTNDIKLFSERIKNEITNGKKELSAGYFCDFTPQSGIWQGQHYDFVQKNISGNHIALVEKGRNGSDVRVMDSAEGVAPHRQFVCDAMDLEGPAEETNLESKNNGDGGKDAAPKKENEMDKREIIRQIMAISAKPVTEFTGGEEEKVETISKLAEKLAYNPSESGAKDICAAKDIAPEKKPGEVKEPEKTDALDEDKDKKEDEEEKPKSVSMDEMEKEIFLRIGRKTELVKKLTPIIGAFDSDPMTEKEVAAYACEKMGKKVAMDKAVGYLEGYLDAQKPNPARVTMAFAQDSAPKANDEVLAQFKEGK